jgi:GDP-L-fucose synthase
MISLKNKKVLVTGGTGLIGQQLIKLLIEKEANIRIVSLDNNTIVPNNIEFMKLDLMDFNNCKLACKDVDIVFNLIGIKTSPKIIQERPSDIFVSYLRFNTNIIEAARQSNVNWFLYVSTVGVYSPSEIMKEDDLWNGFPSKHDWYGGWAKRMGEMQLETYKIQYGLKNYSIVRPANVYGPFDDFSETSMVIPSLIKRIYKREDPFVVWGDGSAIRDFIYSEDAARAMVFAVENKINEPLNIGSGTGISIKTLVDSVIKISGYSPKIVWDTTKPAGDVRRILDTSKINNYGFTPSVSLEDGLKKTLDWYINNVANLENNRYNVFNK